MKNIINRDVLWFWLIKNEPEIVKSLDKSQHTVEFEYPNVFHAESGVKTHILMVMTYIEAKKEYLTDKEYILLITASMLHDIGKPECQETMPANQTKNIRNSFKGHEGCSTFNSIGVLKKLQGDFPDIYTKEIIDDIINIVSLHGTYIDENTNLYKERMIFHEADKKGAVRIVDEELFSQYEKRKYSNVSKKSKAKYKELIMMVGLPGAGKSTLTKEYADKRFSVLSRDEEIFNFYNTIYKDNNKNYNEVYKIIHSEEHLMNFNNYFEKVIQEKSKEDKVIIDMTMLPLSSRRKMISKFPEHNKKAVVVFTDNDTLKDRANTRICKFISDEVYFDMKRSFVMPVLEEGFDEIDIIIN